MAVNLAKCPARWSASPSWLGGDFRGGIYRPRRAQDRTIKDGSPAPLPTYVLFFPISQ